MKNTTRLLLIATLLVLGMVSCSEAEKPAAETTAGADSLARAATDTAMSGQKPTEEIRGNYNGKDILFSHLNFQTYTLNLYGQISNGKMNTERGYGDDRNSTVYVLNSDKPEKEQQCFVRTSAGAFYMLDEGRYVVDDAVFESSAAVSPPVVNSVVAKEATQNTPSMEKKASKKTSTAKRKKKISTIKKAKSKKISKAAKKKKKAKARKKNRKKKRSTKPAQTQGQQ